MLQADPHTLRYTASRFSADSQEIRSQSSRLLGLKTELVSNEWQGKASQSFDAHVEYQVMNMRKIADVLENAASVLNRLASQIEYVMELRRRAEQYEMASWEYSGDTPDDLHHRQNLARQAAYYRQQAEMEATQADSIAAGQFQQIMSMIPNVLSNGGHGVGRSGDLDDLPEPMRSYYRRHPELLEVDSTTEVASTSSWASVKEADDRSIQQDAEVRASLLGLLKQLTQKERMGYWDESTDQQVFEQDYSEMSTDELKAQIFSRLLKNQGHADLEEIAIMNESISTGADFIPIVGNLKSLVEAVTGKDYITSNDLSWLERGFAIAGVFVGGFGKVAGKVVKETSKEVADQVTKHAAPHTIDNVVEGMGNGLKLKTGYDTHLVEVEDVIRKGNKGIVGGHNLDNFNKAFTDRGWSLDENIISKTPHPTINGVYEVKYQFPAVDTRGDIIPGQYKNIPNPKTVYDPSVISNEQMLQWGQEAMANGTVNGRIITGTSSNGLKFQGYIDNGEITNFFPILK